MGVLAAPLAMLGMQKPESDHHVIHAMGPEVSTTGWKSGDEIRVYHAYSAAQCAGYITVKVI